MSRFAAILRKLASSTRSVTISTRLPPTIPKSLKCHIAFASYAKLHASTYASAHIDHLKNQVLDSNVYRCTKMIASYVENHRLGDALNLFDEMSVKDTVVWNLMIKGCLDCGDLDMGMKLFEEMPERNVISCTTMINGLFQYGRVELAEHLFREMPTRDIAAWNAMIHGYFGNKRVEDAVKLFDKMPCRNVISWTSVISGLDQQGRSDEALVLFKQMVGYGVQGTPNTYSCAITACASALALGLGAGIHGHVIKLNYVTDGYIAASMITFYAKCKQIENSCKIFNEKLHKNVAVWTALLTGYGLNLRHGDALKVFADMLKMGVLPNQSSFTSAFNSCCAEEAIDQGKAIHAMAIKLGLETDVFVGNSLIVLYSKCGNITDGATIFEKVAEKNIVSWNAIIVGCAQHGLGMWALTFFNRMMRAGVDPDNITFTGLLSACSHSGILRKGQRLFDYFCHCRSVEVKLEHYACMVDILGRSGKLDEAEKLVKSMPMKANLSVWLALLSSCRMHSNVEVGERAAESIINLDPHCSAAYILLSNLYAFSGRWSDAATVRGKMKKREIVKQPGRSWVSLKGLRHVFLSGDRSHPLSEKIYQKLAWLGEKLKEFGYIPDQRFALHDVEDEQKEAMLAYHSERLAIGFALISTVQGSTITVMKNLRVCGDCHTAIKLMAKIVGREIVLRDSSRFHHFRDGCCSCGDYW
ncbi:hypothetical protein RJ640_012780 [Escallonia rubra]|uniref:DYW domain-containing protein n=1 Tax=Escallonia rubra TaxID=112253 RepID=A0AA88S0Z4_9ASTE|nr:hypothetical protein RJ640_012780 [Escallonia rubra]